MTSESTGDVEPEMPRAQPAPSLTAVPDFLNNGATRRPFGHTADRVHVVEEEAAAIRSAARRVLAGETLSAIVEEWNRVGLKTAGGGPWRVNSLSNLLLQPRLVGPPAIVDEDTHARLVALHSSRRKGPRRTTRRYLLRGMLRCWRCGGTLRGMPRSRGADLYVCTGPPHGGCSGTAVTADRAEDAVRDLVLARLDSRVPPAVDVNAHEAVRALKGHRQRLLDLGDLWASGDISRDEWLSLKRNVSRRAKAAEAQVDRLKRVTALRRVAGAGTALRARWPEMTFDERRSIVEAALDHVVVLAAEPPRQVFRAERLQPRWFD